MSRWEVQLVESRDLVFVVEAETKEAAVEIAQELEANDAARDSFRERSLDWVEPL